MSEKHQVEIHYPPHTKTSEAINKIREGCLCRYTNGWVKVAGWIRNVAQELIPCPEVDHATGYPPHPDQRTAEILLEPRTCEVCQATFTRFEMDPAFLRSGTYICNDCAHKCEETLSTTSPWWKKISEVHKTAEEHRGKWTCGCGACLKARDVARNRGPLEVTRQNLEAAFIRVLPNAKVLMEVRTITIPCLLRMAAEHCFTYQVSEDNDTRLIRRALKNLETYPVYADAAVAALKAGKD